MVRVRWYDKEVEREVDRKTTDLLNRIGARGEAISKKLISGELQPALRAVDKGFLMNSLSWIIDVGSRRVRIGTYIARSDGKPLHYAVYVFLGTIKMKARPVLRTMLALLKAEMKTWT
jgi:hypothetical protein